MNIVSSTPDQIAAKIAERDARHIARWGEPCRTWPLDDVAHYKQTPRYGPRNKLLEALKADGRFTVALDRELGLTVTLK